MKNNIEKLKLAEKDFIAWLDEIKYDKIDSNKRLYHYEEKIRHYRLIEGVKEVIDKRVSFIYSHSGTAPHIVVNARFPKAEQKLSIDQFYEWMESPEKQKDSFLQQF